jgi:hypothetical protein
VAGAVLTLTGVLGCAEPTATVGSIDSLGTAPAAVLGGVQGTIDLRTGALEFTPLPAVSASPLGLSRAVYGDQNVLTRLYNTAVAVDSVSVPGTRTWSGNVGLQNLTSHFIGDEQTGATPTEIMGVFVFFNSTPTVTSPIPCPGCTVTINQSDGSGNFTAPGQRYSWWGERIAAGDTTRTRKLWSFSAPSQVRTFSFTVLVGAAWPAPDETRWKVTLNNDSIPDTQEEPRWRRQTLGTGNSAAAAGGNLTLTTTSTTGELDFYRRDSLAANTSAYIEARMSSTVTTAAAAPILAIDDGNKFMAVAAGSATAWFADTSRAYLAGTPVAVTTGAMNVYQLRKYGADSIVFYLNGARAGRFTYSALPNTGYPGAAPLQAFGQRARGVTVTSTWDYVVYEIGSAVP